MSNASSTLLGLAVGAGGGYLVWRLSRDGKGERKPDASPIAETRTADPAHPSKSKDGKVVTAAPPRVPGVCSLKLDKNGITADGEAVDVRGAVARCKLDGKAELALAPDAPGSVAVELHDSLRTSGIPVVIKSV